MGIGVVPERVEVDAVTEDATTLQIPLTRRRIADMTHVQAPRQAESLRR